MALVLKNRVQETATSVTLVDFTLGGALSGFQAFSVIGNANTTYYTATDTSGNWEVGLGTYVSSTNTLNRNTVFSSSSGGSGILFPGSINVYCDYPAEKSVNLDTSGNVSALGTIASGTWNATTIAPTVGGTGLTTIPANRVLLGNGTSSLLSIVSGTAGQYLTSNGPSAPTWTSPASTYTRTSFTATAGQTIFTVTYTVGLVQVYINGVLLNASDYTASSGTDITLAVAAVVGDIVEVVAFTAVGISGGGSAQLASVLTTGTAATYTVPAGTTTLKVTIQGPGADGGGNTGNRGTGGSAGATCIKWLAVSPGDTLTYTVGVAGVTPTNSTVTYGATTYTAGAGAVGANTAYAASYTAGPVGGTATNGDINIPGNPGGPSYGTSAVVGTQVSGAGGNSLFGQGGTLRAITASNGANATGYGAGGGGSNGGTVRGTSTGGIIIFEPQ